MKLLIGLAIGTGVLTVFVAGFLWYMGIFNTLEVSEQEVGPYTYAYESFVGPYAKTQPVFDKVYSDLLKEGITTINGIGLYYDDPSKVPAEKLRSDCGSIIEAKDLGRITELQQKYKIGQLSRKLSIVVKFPIKNPLSYMIGPSKGYPALMKYAQEKGYQMAMPYELYLPKEIWYVMEVIK